MKKETIVIIWWTWKFWSFWSKYFEQRWYDVIISSRKTELKPKEAVKKWDIIIVSVPIRFTVWVIKEIVPHMWKWKLLMDFTWIKIDASKELATYKDWEVVATHPMFWPWIDSLKNQNIAFDPISPWEKWKKIYSCLQKDWANLMEMSSKKHDELVSIVQSTVHILNLVLWHVLKERNINLDELMMVSTPNSRLQLCILSRFFKQEASLYTDMQMYNSIYKNEILLDIDNYFRWLEITIESNNTQKFESEFQSIKNYLWDEFIDKNFNITKQIDAFIKNNN